ncbi:MAG: hypothetical protein AAFQ66_10790 [Pseudomonadota bacterium]
MEIVRPWIWCAVLASMAGVAWGDDRATIGEIEIVVLSSRDGCRIVMMSQHGDQVEPLALSGLCTLHRNEEGAVRQVSGPDGPIFLVEHSVAARDGSGDCLTNVQAVAVSEQGLVVAPNPALVATCPPFRWDEVMFLGVF